MNLRPSKTGRNSTSGNGLKTNIFKKPSKNIWSRKILNLLNYFKARPRTCVRARSVEKNNKSNKLFQRQPRTCVQARFGRATSRPRRHSYHTSKLTYGWPNTRETIRPTQTSEERKPISCTKSLCRYLSRSQWQEIPRALGGTR